MKARLPWYDYITINSYWFGLTVIAQTMTPLIVPILVQQFVGETSKGTYYGILRFGTLMIAVLAQSFMGYLSDRSTIRFGRRRPFILSGTLLSLILMAAIGFIAGLSGMNGYWLLLFLLILLAISSNASQAAQQGLINDLVPAEERGRFSGVKALLEIPLPILFVAFTVARLVSRGEILLGILASSTAVLVSMLIAMFVREKPRSASGSSRDWKPILRLARMTGLYAGVILVCGFLVRIAVTLIAGIESAAFFLIFTGAAGFLGMLAAVSVGVWVSIRAGLGDSAVNHSNFTWWIINRLAFLLGVNNLGSFAVYFLQGRLGFIREEAVSPAANLLTIVGIFILITAVPAGWLSDRYGPKRLVFIAGLLAAAGTLVTLSFPSMPVIYLGGSIIGAATGLFFSANWSLGTNLVPPDEAGHFLGIANLAGAGAGAIGAFIGGALADQVSILLPGQPGSGYILLFAIYGVMFMVSVFVLQFVGKASPSISSAALPGA